MIRCKVSGAIVPNSNKWIYEWLGMEATCPKDIEKALADAISKNDELVIEINSGGGSLFSGIEIYSMIKNHTGKITTEITGLAGSAASIVAVAATCRMHAPSMMMIHNSQGAARGDYNEMDKESNLLQNANKSIAAAYHNKTGMSEEEILQLMNRESWMPAARAVELGFADEVIEDKPVDLLNSIYAGVLPRDTIEKIRASVKSPEQREQETLELEAERLNLLNLQEVM